MEWEWDESENGLTCLTNDNHNYDNTYAWEVLAWASLDL